MASLPGTSTPATSSNHNDAFVRGEQLLNADAQNSKDKQNDAHNDIELDVDENDIRDGYKPTGNLAERLSIAAKAVRAFNALHWKKKTNRQEFTQQIYSAWMDALISRFQHIRYQTYSKLSSPSPINLYFEPWLTAAVNDPQAAKDLKEVFVGTLQQEFCEEYGPEWSAREGLHKSFKKLRGIKVKRGTYVIWVSDLTESQFAAALQVLQRFSQFQQSNQTMQKDEGKEHTPIKEAVRQPEQIGFYIGLSEDGNNRTGVHMTNLEGQYYPKMDSGIWYDLGRLYSEKGIIWTSDSRALEHGDPDLRSFIIRSQETATAGIFDNYVCKSTIDRPLRKSTKLIIDCVQDVKDLHQIPVLAAHEKFNRESPLKQGQCLSLNFSPEMDDIIRSLWYNDEVNNGERWQLCYIIEQTFQTKGINSGYSIYSIYERLGFLNLWNFALTRYFDDSFVFDQSNGFSIPAPKALSNLAHELIKSQVSNKHLSRDPLAADLIEKFRHQYERDTFFERAQEYVTVAAKELNVSIRDGNELATYYQLWTAAEYDVMVIEVFKAKSSRQIEPGTILNNMYIEVLKMSPKRSYIQVVNRIYQLRESGRKSIGLNIRKSRGRNQNSTEDLLREMSLGLDIHLQYCTATVQGYDLGDPSMIGKTKSGVPFLPEEQIIIKDIVAEYVAFPYRFPARAINAKCYHKITRPLLEDSHPINSMIQGYVRSERS